MKKIAKQNKKTSAFRKVSKFEKHSKIKQKIK